MKRRASRLTLWITPRGMSWFVLAFFVVMLLSVLLAPDPWPRRSAIFPLIVAVICIALSLVETAVAYIPALQRRFAPTSVLDLGLTTDLSKDEVYWRSNQALVWMALLLAGIVTVGFHVALPIFIVAYLRLLARAGWLAAAIYAAVVWIVLFVVFERMMEIRWPPSLADF